MKHSWRNLLILTFVLFVVMLGYGIIIPILPFYIEKMGAGGTELGLLVASYGLMRMICGPIWGSLSDRIGRKPVLIIGILGYAITMIWFGLADRMWMLFAARILSGALSSATAPTTMAYIGDSTSEKARGSGMGLLGAAGGIGAILGPALGGALAVEVLSTPFFIAGGLSVFSMLLAWVFLPESLPRAGGETAEKQARILDLRLWIKTVRGPIGILLWLTLISASGLMIFSSVFGLYALERFSYGPDDIGVMMMVMGLATALAQGALAGLLTKHWGEEATIKVGLSASIFGFAALVLARDYWSVLLAVAFLGLCMALQTPALSALISRRAAGAQGAVMGLSNSFVSLGRIIGPLLAGFLFDTHFVLPFFFGAGFMCIGFVVSLIYLPQAKKAVVPSSAMEPGSSKI